MPTALQQSLSTINSLSQDAGLQLLQIKEQQARLNLVKLDIDLLKREYLLRSSWFDSMARWYGESSWYKSDGFAILLCTSLGAVNVVALIVFVAFYMAVTTVLKNHYEMEKGRLDSLIERVQEIETNLQTNMELFNTCQNRFFALCGELQQKNELLAAYLRELNEQQMDLEEQTQSLRENVSRLSKESEVISKTDIATLSGIENAQARLDNLSTSFEGLMKAALEFTQPKPAISETSSLVEVIVSPKTSVEQEDLSQTTTLTTTENEKPASSSLQPQPTDKGKLLTSSHVVLEIQDFHKIFQERTKKSQEETEKFQEKIRQRDKQRLSLKIPPRSIKKSDTRQTEEALPTTPSFSS